MALFCLAATPILSDLLLAAAAAAAVALLYVAAVSILLHLLAAVAVVLLLLAAVSILAVSSERLASLTQSWPRPGLLRACAFYLARI